MSLDLYQLRAFFTVAQTLNFSEAARKMCVTQSAVSHAVAKLERSAKGELFKRTGSRLSLSESGKILYRACETVFYALEKAEEGMSAAEGRSLGAIKLGATVEFGTTQLVKFLKGFMESDPGIQIDFRFDHELLRPLLKDELDIIIDCKNHNAEGLEKTPLFREEYVVIAVREFVKRRGIRSPGDLSGCRVLSIDKSAKWWGNFLNALPAGGRPEFSSVTEMTHIRAIINAALEGLGVKNIREVDAYRQAELTALVREALAEPGFKVIIARHPCMLKLTREARRRAGAAWKVRQVRVDPDTCVKNHECIERFACPSFQAREGGAVEVSRDLCIGDGSCRQTCPAGALVQDKEEGR